jgi:hypothetical protein
MEPTVVFPPATPFTLQVTAVFVLPVTVAMYCAEVASVTVVAPSRARVTGSSDVVFGVASATGRLFETVGVAALVAVIVTFGD